MEFLWRGRRALLGSPTSFFLLEDKTWDLTISGKGLYWNRTG